MPVLDLPRFVAWTVGLALGACGPTTAPPRANSQQVVTVPDAEAPAASTSRSSSNPDDAAEADAGAESAGEAESQAGIGSLLPPSSAGSSGGGSLGHGGSSGLAPADVRSVMQSAVPELRRCYARALERNPNLSAKFAIKFEIAPSGAVSSANVAPPSPDPALDACVLARVRSLIFPASNGAPVRVSYPLVFSQP